MSFLESFTYPFKYFVALIGELPNVGLFWAVVVALCACGASYLINIVIIRRRRHD